LVSAKAAPLQKAVLAKASARLGQPNGRNSPPPKSGLERELAAWVPRLREPVAPAPERLRAVPEEEEAPLF
jgi:hypothetical protein